MNVSVLEVANVLDNISVSDCDLLGGGAGSVEEGVAGLQFEAVFVVGSNDVGSDDGGVVVLVAASEDVGGAGVGVGEGGGLGLHDGGGLVGLLLSGLGNEEVVVGLLEVEFGDSQSVHGVLELGSEFGDEEVGVVEGGVHFSVDIHGNFVGGLGFIVDLDGQVEGVSCGIDDKVGLGLLVKGSGKDLFGALVCFEGKVVDILGVEGSCEGGLGVLSGLAGLGFSIDEDIVGFLEFLSPEVEDFLSIFKISLGNGHNFPLVVDVGDGQSHDFVSDLKDLMGFGLGGISSGSLSGSCGDLGLSGVLLGGGKVEGKGGFAVELSSGFNFLLFVVDDLDGGKDSGGGLELLPFDLLHIVLNGDVSVGDIDEVGG